MADTSASPAAPSCLCLERLLERQGYRELGAAHLFSAGVALAPTLDEKQMFARHCLDELGHFEHVAMRYDELGRGDLLSKVAPKVAELPAPESWLEMVLVGIAFDRAVYFQLRAYAAAPDSRVAALAVHVIADEAEHLAASQAALADFAAQDAELRDRLEALLARWLPISSACFDDSAVESACPAGPHVSAEAQRAAERAYFESLEAVLGPRGVRVERLPAGSWAK